MPLWDIVCKEHGLFEDEFYKERPAQFSCPKCGERCEVKVGVIDPQGIIGEPQFVEQLGKTFRTNREKEAYMRKRGLREMGPDEGKQYKIQLEQDTDNVLRKNHGKSVDDVYSRRPHARRYY